MLKMEQDCLVEAEAVELVETQDVDGCWGSSPRCLGRMVQGNEN